MTDPRSSDRDAILARRALFISTALAGLACSTKPSADSREQPVVQGERAGDGEVGEAGEDNPPARPEEVRLELRPWADAIAGAPPSDVPEGLTKPERDHLNLQAEGLKAMYAEIEAMWARTPDCAAGAAGCTVWTEAASLIGRYDEDRERMAFDECRSPTGETGTLAARRAAHKRYMRALLTELEAHLTGVARSFGRESATAWRSMLAMEKGPQPMPCLSDCARIGPPDLVAMVPFAEGSADLRVDDPAVQAALDVLSSQAWAYGGRVLAVRGHADPSEPEPEALAERRAQAVADWLTQNVKPEPALEVVSLGATFLVRRGEAGLDVNPRVDFEVVAKTPAPAAPGPDELR